MSRSKLRHLALTARRAEILALFYRDHLAMEIFHREPDGSHFLTDGYLNLAIIQQAPDGDVPAGFNHFGFEVTDLPAWCERLVAAGFAPPVPRFTRRPFAEYRVTDPEGNWFDVSQHGFSVPTAR